MKFSFILCIFTLFYFSLSAQVKAPSLLCISADSLIFQIPNNTCGAFNAYEVYGSQDRNGPYILLGRITERIKSSFVHTGINQDELWYYYMQSDYDCPSVTILSSDTLDNSPPNVAHLKSISIENEILRLSWYPSLSPQTIGYVIYRLTNQGTTPIDTVFFNTSYVDIFAKPNEGAEVYFVVAMDACGNTSEFVESHHSVFLETSVSSCEQTIRLNWNLYENWVEGIEAHEIWVSVDSSVAERVAVIEGNLNFYNFENAEDNVVYSFYVKVIETGTGVAAKSNVSIITADVVNPVGDLLLKNVTFNDNNEIEILWEWNENAQLQSAELFRSFDNRSFQSLGIPDLSVPLSAISTYTFPPSYANEAQTFYRVNTVDNCDISAVSNYASTIFLSGTAQINKENLLDWTLYDSKAGTATGYVVYKIIDDSPVFLGRLDGNTSSFSDPVINAADATACYYIEAEITIPFAKSGIEMFISRSNIACIAQSARIVMPNAFAPHGQNQVFKPTILFGEGIQKYQLVIYNRYGGKIFESQDVNIGWNGKKDGKDVLQGTYSYYIRIEQSNGNVSDQGGVLVLLR